MKLVKIQENPTKQNNNNATQATQKFDILVSKCIWFANPKGVLRGKIDHNGHGNYYNVLSNIVKMVFEQPVRNINVKNNNNLVARAHRMHEKIWCLSKCINCI